LIFSISLDIFN